MIGCGNQIGEIALIGVQKSMNIQKGNDAQIGNAHIIRERVLSCDISVRVQFQAYRTN